MRDSSDELDFLELSPECAGSTPKSCVGKTSFSKGKLSGKCEKMEPRLNKKYCFPVFREGRVRAMVVIERLQAQLVEL